MPRLLTALGWGLLGTALLALPLVGESSGRVVAAYGLGTLLLAALGLGVSGALLEGRLAPPRRDALIPGILLAGAMLWAAWRAPEPWSGRLTLVEWGMGAGVALVLSGWASAERAQGAASAVLAGGAALSVYALYQWGWGLSSLALAVAAEPSLAFPASATGYARGLVQSRLATREPYGSFAISNTLAGLMLLMGSLSAGLAVDRHKEGRRAQALALGFLALASLLVLVMTGSKGAWLAGGAVPFAWALRRLWRRSRVACLALMALPAAALAWRLADGGELASSLSFRLGYWVAAGRMVLEHPWAGLGLGAFSVEYNRYRSVWARDVMFAHCAPLQLWAEAGIWGLVSALWLAGLCWTRGRSALPSCRRVSRPAMPSVLGALVGLILLGLPTALPPAFFFSHQGLRFTVATLMAVAAGLAAWSSSGPWGPGAKLGALGGTAAFGLHSLGDFGLSVPGSAVCWWAILGILAAQVPGEAPSSSRPGRAALGALLLVLGLAAAFLLHFVLPGLSAEQAVASASRQLWNATAPLGEGDYRRLSQAVEDDPGRAEAWELLGEAAERRWRSGERQALHSAILARETAARLTPGNRRVRWDLAWLYLACSRQDRRCVGLAVRWADAAVSAHPTAPIGRMQAARMRRELLEVGLAEQEAERLRSGIDEAYRAALSLDREVRQENLKLSRSEREEAEAWASGKPLRRP